MASPAASSFAELMRNPVDKRSIVVPMDRSLRVIALAAMFADILVLIEAIVLFLLLVGLAPL
jgi:hypothetical protein